MRNASTGTIRLRKYAQDKQKSRIRIDRLEIYGGEKTLRSIKPANQRA